MADWHWECDPDGLLDGLPPEAMRAVRELAGELAGGRLAAQRHAEDMLGNPNLDGDIGSDGSTAQDRARAAGYRGTVTETVRVCASRCGARNRPGCARP